MRPPQQRMLPDIVVYVEWCHSGPRHGLKGRQINKDRSQRNVDTEENDRIAMG